MAVAKVLSFLKPEMVTPLVAYFCSNECQTTGDIISAGGGYYAKIQMVEGKGVRLPPESQTTPEIIAKRYAEIRNMESVTGSDSAQDNMMAVIRPLMKEL